MYIFAGFCVRKKKWLPAPAGARGIAHVFVPSDGGSRVPQDGSGSSHRPGALNQNRLRLCHSNLNSSLFSKTLIIRLINLLPPNFSSFAISCFSCVPFIKVDNLTLFLLTAIFITHILILLFFLSASAFQIVQTLPINWLKFCTFEARRDDVTMVI